MTRGEITKNLSRLTEKLINPHRDPRIYWAREVTFDAVRRLHGNKRGNTLQGWSLLPERERASFSEESAEIGQKKTVIGNAFNDVPFGGERQGARRSK